MSEDDDFASVEFDVEEAANDDRIPDRYQVGEEVEEHKSTTQQLVEGIRSDPKAKIGLVLVVMFFLTAIFAPVIALHPPDKTYELTQPPNSYSTGDYDDDGQVEKVWHPLGTTSFGYDLFSRMVFGARVSLLVAFATMVVAFVIGTAIGIVAAYYRGWVDDILMRLVDFQWAFPELILAIGIIAFAGGRGVWNVVLAVGIAYIDDFARLIRGEVLSIREQEYVQAAEAVGMSNVRVMVKEIFPNAIAPLIVQATILIPLAILAEAGLSFLGLGVQPTTPTWGIIINSGRQFITSAWWISVMPGLAIMFTVLGFNLFGDGLRDILDVSEQEVDAK